MTQSEHEKWNLTHYPGTRQLCSECGEPTERCEEDAVHYEDKGPLCDACLETINVIILTSGEIKCLK